MAWATCVAQLATNNWFVVYYALKRLDVPPGRYLRRVVLPVAGVMLSSAAVALGLKTGLPHIPGLIGTVRGLPVADLVGMAVGAAATVACAFVLFWRLAIDGDARGAVRLQMRRLAARSA